MHFLPHKITLQAESGPEILPEINTKNYIPLLSLRRVYYVLKEMLLSKDSST
jgi:hypothetical protein